MNKKDTVVFDLDGTLLDTLEDLKNSVNYAMTQCGYPEHTLDEVRRYVGNGIPLLMQRAIPGGKDDPNFDKAFTLFKEHYGKHCNDTTKPYAGITELLHTLKENNIKIAIVSNKADFAVKELNAIYFKDFFMILYGFLFIYLSGVVLDAIVFSGFNSRAVYIITSDPEAVKNKIYSVLERGVTEIYSRGGYKQEDKKMLVCVMSNNEFYK